ncbi:MAG: hypothetical protein ACK52I_06310 [Pseudomonadota bacterium]
MTDIDEYQAILAAFDRPARPAPARTLSEKDQRDLAAAAAVVDEMDALLDSAKEQRKQALETIKTLVDPPEEGEHAVEARLHDATAYRITFKRGEPRLKWDTDALLHDLWNELAVNGAVPAELDIKVSISRDVFERMPPEKAARYAPALTREPGTLRISVERITPVTGTKE